MRIGFFGKLRDSLGEELEITAEAGRTVARLRIRLAALYPNSASDLLSPRTRACVADAIVGEEYPLDGVDRIEFLPPLSGG